MKRSWQVVLGPLLALMMLVACGGQGGTTQGDGGTAPPAASTQAPTAANGQPTAAVTATTIDPEATTAATSGATGNATTAATGAATSAATGAATTSATGAATSAATTSATGAATSEATTGTTGSSGQPVADLQGRKLIIGSDTTYPPMEYVDEQKQIVGFDVDMANEIAKLTNSTVEFQTFPSFDAIFAALANKEFDAVISSVSITDERKQIIDFSDPYLAIGQAITVPSNNSTITDVEGLKSASLVGVQGGTTGEQAAKDAGVPEANIKRYDTIDLAFQDLANGAVDAVVADGPPSVNYVSKSNGAIKVVGEPFTTENYAIAIQKGDTELLSAVNAALKEMKANGTMQRLVEKWDMQNIAALP